MASKNIAGKIADALTAIAPTFNLPKLCE